MPAMSPVRCGGIAGGGSAGDANLLTEHWRRFSATVSGGGQGNRARSIGSTVSGGLINTASGIASVVSGGSDNTASGRFSSVGGGANNCAGGRLSWAGGRSAKVRPGSGPSDPGKGCANVEQAGSSGDAGTFVWADSSPVPFVSTGSDQFLIRAAGGVGINTNDPETSLHVRGGSPDVSPFGQLILEDTATSGAAGTGGGISFFGHDGNIRRILGGITSVKENSTVGSTQSRMSFFTRGSSGLPVERVRITGNGTVGINTNVPQRQLHVKQQTNFNSSSGITLERSGSSGDQWGLYVSSSNDFIFVENNSARGRIRWRYRSVQRHFRSARKARYRAVGKRAGAFCAATSQPLSHASSAQR